MEESYLSCGGDLLGWHGCASALYNLFAEPSCKPPQTSSTTIQGTSKFYLLLKAFVQPMPIMIWIAIVVEVSWHREIIPTSRTLGSRGTW